MEYALLGSIVTHSVTNGFGIIANMLLVYLALFKTPKQLTLYAPLILNVAVCDLFACLAAIFVQQRIIPDGLGLYYFSHGPCRVSGPLTCFIGYSLMLHCYAHSLWSLLFSFSYRYYVLCYLHPRKCIIKAIIVVIYIPSFIQFVSFCFASDNESKVRAVIVRNFGYDVTSECVSGHLNILHAETLYTILHMTIPIVPIYTAILILRKLTMLKLHCQGNMSEKTRHLHSQLLKALTVQACLPILFLFAVTTYGIGQLKIYNHPLLEYSTFILIGLIPMLSPLTSIYFVSPYRVWIFNKLREPWTRCRMWTAQSHPHMEFFTTSNVPAGATSTGGRNRCK